MLADALKRVSVDKARVPQKEREGTREGKAGKRVKAKIADLETG